MSRNSAVLPLNERKMDWFFIIFFGLFAFTSLAADLVNAVSHPAPGSTYFWANATYELYAKGNDPLLVANPEWLRAMTFLSAFVFGPFYILMVVAFAKGWNRIRPWAIFYAGMIIESMIVLVYTEFKGEAALFAQMAHELKSASELAAAGLSADLKVMNPAKFLAFNLPYAVVPLLLAIRMWRPKPFSAEKLKESDL
ncbi:MAG: emopamil-binding family protein [Spirochaetaceae bacterium]|nr:emopamil-binding family protein [Spirochaetaceae bacterium]MDT8297581.1 emopamil-binding family protein [Spirochaetaceae bacterium]